MVCDGSLVKMKTREKKYKPIALHVNMIHHLSDPVVYPWEWSWKDVSNKVQNMRHQYSLVKQKIKQTTTECGGEGFEWVEGLTHWSNFIRYKEVFGDVTLPFGNGFDENSHGNDGIEVLDFGNIGNSGDGEYVGGIGGGHNGVMGLEFEYDGAEGEENYDGGNENENGNGNGNENHVFGEIETMGSETKKKKKVVKNLEKKAWGFVANQLAQLREMEARFEQREEERERERQRRESIRAKNEEEHKKQHVKLMERLKEQRNREWESMENEREERRRRRDEELIQDRKWEERMSRRRLEWKGRIDEMLSEHRAEMTQIQGRILHEQQNLTSQLLGIVSQWSGHPGGIADNTTASGHYLSQMMQNLQHVGGMVDGDTRVEGHNQEDQFIVDG
uniref:stress response protein NST1-like n=1 Tax=Erigeron canadensis TaxID=72917 RepID=UPI001CB8BC47|nr:stress response protein NST1-like [Erigeron canadensis]